jgi:hypothetical protein
MLPADCPEFGVSAGAGDAVVCGKEVTGVVPSGFCGVVVHPRVTSTATSTRKTKTDFKDNVDPDISLHPLSIIYISTCLIIFITSLRQTQANPKTSGEYGGCDQR